MGTRHLIAVQKDGDYKIAQYGQWDGYPEGQGAAVLNFLHEADLDKFKEKLDGCTFLSDEELNGIYLDCGATERDGEIWLGFEAGKKFRELYPQMSRDTGAEILKLVNESESGLKLSSDIEFAKDSLFCEFAYVIDFDSETFEVYRGFNKSPLSDNERFAGEADREYYPVKLDKTFQLSQLPSESQFLAAFSEDED